MLMRLPNFNWHSSLGLPPFGLRQLDQPFVFSAKLFLWRIDSFASEFNRSVSTQNKFLRLAEIFTKYILMHGSYMEIDNKKTRTKSMRPLLCIDFFHPRFQLL